jgi:hypothetical protein
VRATTRAVRRINADKQHYLHYFIRSAADQAAGAGLPPELTAGLSASDFNLARIQAKEPGPVPEDQALWAWQWMAGWGLLDGEFDARAQINHGMQDAAFSGAVESD